MIRLYTGPEKVTQGNNNVRSLQLPPTIQFSYFKHDLYMD